MNGGKKVGLELSLKPGILQTYFSILIFMSLYSTRMKGP